jgi:hypothetical protein
MQFAAETDRSGDSVFVSIPNIANDNYLLSIKGHKIQAVQRCLRAWIPLRYGQCIAELENDVSSGWQEGGDWGEENGGFAKYFWPNWQCCIIIYSISSICYSCCRSAYVGNRHDTFDLHSISNWNGRYATQYTVERYSPAAQSWPMGGDECSVGELDGFPREASLAASSTPKCISESGYENCRDSGYRSIVSVKKVSEVGSDQVKVAERQHFISGLIFIVGVALAVLWLAWRAWRDRF